MNFVRDLVNRFGASNVFVGAGDTVLVANSDFNTVRDFVGDRYRSVVHTLDFDEDFVVLYCYTNSLERGD